MVGGSTRIPAVQGQLKTNRKRPHKGTNPDECVALGIQYRQVYWVEDWRHTPTCVHPLSLGIETLGGVFTKLIERNTLSNKEE